MKMAEARPVKPALAKIADPTPTPPTSAPRDGIAEVKIDVPHIPSNAVLIQRIDGKIDLFQAKTCRVILDALMQRQARLRDGHVIDGHLDVFRWLLEQAGGAIGVADPRVPGHRING